MPNLVDEIHFPFLRFRVMRLCSFSQCPDQRVVTGSLLNGGDKVVPKSSSGALGAQTVRPVPLQVSTGWASCSPCECLRQPLEREDDQIPGCKHCCTTETAGVAASFNLTEQGGLPAEQSHSVHSRLATFYFSNKVQGSRSLEFNPN